MTFSLRPPKHTLIYLREDVEIGRNNQRMYEGGHIVRIDESKLARAFDLLPTITDQHLRPRKGQVGVAQRFHGDGMYIHVYGVENSRVQHISIKYEPVLPLLRLIYALNLPSPVTDNSLGSWERIQKKTSPAAF